MRAASCTFEEHSVLRLALGFVRSAESGSHAHRCPAPVGSRDSSVHDRSIPLPDTPATRRPDQVTEFVEQTASAIGLAIRPEHLPGVLENTVRIHTLAQLFLEFPIAEDVEDAGVFQP